MNTVSVYTFPAKPSGSPPKVCRITQFNKCTNPVTAALLPLLHQPLNQVTHVFTVLTTAQQRKVPNTNTAKIDVLSINLLG